MSRRPPRQLRRFFLGVYALTAMTQVPFVVAAARLLVRVGVHASIAWATALGLGLAAAVGIHGRVAIAVEDRPLSSARVALLEEPYYAHWCAALLATPLWLVTSLVLGMAWLAGLDAPRADDAAIVIYLASLTLGVWSVMVRRKLVRVRSLDVKVRDLPRAFDGYRVAHLSDVHVGAFCPRARVDRWVDLVNARGVDLVALTGDYVTSGVAFHADIAASLTRLRGKDGVVAVMGNHDYFGDGEPMMSLLKAGGVVMLRNQSRAIARGGEHMMIVGVDDTRTRRADVALAMNDVSGAALVLAHDPELFPALAAAGASVVLSGHTHWGQIGVPFFIERLNPSRLVHRFSAGLHRIGKSTLWISPGLGTTGPPVRLGAAPEITFLRLLRDDAATTEV
jgi:hypothetical protein